MKRIFLVLPILTILVGCANDPSRPQSSLGQTQHWKHKKIQVRTTAYTHTERGGARNAVGGRLSSGPVKSAASDWSRFPLGTKFKLIETGEIYRVDDYGSALVGTNTIDLYKTSRAGVRRWGVRYVDIQILEWGCSDRSLRVLEPRGRRGYVRRMIHGLRTKQTAS